MTITLNADYDVTLNTALLGYVGETNARPVSVEGLTVDGADRYVLTIDYGDGVTYEVDITGGQWTPTADILRSAQTVSCQICAKKLSGDEYILVKKSRIFRLRIGAAIGDTAIPSPDVAVDALDRIDAIGRQAHADMQTAVTAAETATTAAENAKKSATAAEKSADTATQAASRAETAQASAETSAAQAETARQGAETAAQTALENADSVNQLKEDLTDLKTNQPNLFWKTGSNLLDETLLVDGSRLGSDGNIMNDFPAGCATVNYIDISSLAEKYVSAYTIVNGKAMRCFYRISFYASESNSGHLKTYSAAGVADMSQSVVEIPKGAKFIRVSYNYTSSTGGKFMLISGESDMKPIPYEKYHLKISIVPENLNDILNNYNDILNKYTFGTYPHHEDNAVLTISKLRNSFTFNQNDFTFVKDELWLAKCNTTDFSNGTGVFRYKWDGEQFVHIGTINCDFGHWNVVDYCEANDCLIFGNGANDFETEGNYFVVIPHPLELGNTALIADAGIKYNVDIGYKVQALWGDSNLGENNIAVLLSNDLKTIVKVLLKRDSSGNFNGEFIELERKENLPAFGIQGADIWNNTLYVGGAESSGVYTINKVSLSDYSSVKNSVKYYKDDGTPYLGVVQGVYVGGDYVWVFVNTDAPQTGKCCFLTKYRR
jgi:hypothetical protein